MVSIIVPVYNVEKQLARCLDSILLQTYENFELILVNDGSKDKSGDICDSYEKKDKRITVIHKENGGVSDARNRGIEKATGDYIMFVDSDDVIASNLLECARKKIANNDLYVSGITILNYNGEKFISKEDYNVKKEEVVDVRKILVNAFREYARILICGPCCKLYRRQIIKENEIKFDVNMDLGEDTLFNLEYLKNLQGTIYLDNKSYYSYYRCDNQTLFNKPHENKYEIEERIYDEWRNVLIANGANEQEIIEFNEQYAIFLVNCVYYTFKNYNDKVLRKKVINKILSNTNGISKYYKAKSFKTKLIKIGLRLKSKAFLYWLFRLAT